MENASKALIIAGAILLSILIIGLGMYIYQMASGAMDNINIDSNKIQAYNAPFLAYEGTNVSGTQARALCDVVRNHNNAHLTDPTQQIQVFEKQGEATKTTKAPEENVDVSTITAVKSNLRAGKTYTVDFGYDSKTGYIVAIEIFETAEKTNT